MTASHCLYDFIGSGFIRRRVPRDIRTASIYMDYYQPYAVDPTIGGVTANVIKLIAEDRKKDYALLRVDKDLYSTYGYLTLDTAYATPSTTDSVTITSHPRGREKEIVRNNSEIVAIPSAHPLSSVASAIGYLADTESGSSGAPVLLDGGTTVIAIHTGQSHHVQLRPLDGNAHRA